MAMSAASHKLYWALFRQKNAIDEVIEDLRGESVLLSHRLVDDSWSGPARWAFDRELDQLRSQLARTLNEFVLARDATSLSIRELGAR